MQLLLLPTFILSGAEFAIRGLTLLREVTFIHLTRFKLVTILFRYTNTWQAKTMNNYDNELIIKNSINQTRRVGFWGFVIAFFGKFLLLETRQVK